MGNLGFQEHSAPEMQIDLENKAYLAEISNITGVSVPEINVDELKALYRGNFSRGKSYSPPPFKAKYLGSFSPHSDRVYQLIEAMTDMPAGVLSYGLFLPEYLEMMKRYSAKTGSSKPHTSLLLGAQTTTTIKEYALAVRRVFPDSSCHVADIEKREVGDSGVIFETANALELPDSYTGKFNTLHTNALIQNLRGSEDRWDFEENGQILLNNAYRVLRPNGALIMVDAIVNNNGSNDRGLFEQSLRSSGFGDIKIEPAKQFLNRRHLDRVLQGTEDILRAPLTNSPLFSIYATKTGMR